MMARKYWATLAAALIVSSVGMSGRLLGPAEGADYRLVEVENPVFRENELFVSHEDLRSPRFSELIQRYALDKIVADETGEFKRILLLRNWIKKNIAIENVNPTQTRGDAFGILDAAFEGGRFHCGHFMVVQHAVLNAFGYLTRCLGVGPGGTPEHPGGHHGVNEVWSNEYLKWVLVDAKYDTHFEKEGIPLSALEVRDELLRDGALGITCVRGPDRLPVEGPEEPEGGPVTYRWLSWEIQGNRHSNWPHFHSSALVTYADKYYRTHKWWRIGRTNLHWAYEAGYFIPTPHREWIEWTPNVLKVTASIDQGRVDGSIVSSTPNLKEYQVCEKPGTDWRPLNSHFSFRLTRERHEWQLRAVNLAGVTGPSYSLVVARKEEEGDAVASSTTTDAAYARSSGSS
jgi:hypothetical protein